MAKEGKEARDYAKEIGGAFSIEKAEEMFGKANAQEAYKRVANAGGYGYDGSTSQPLAVGDAKTAGAINDALTQWEAEKK